MLKRAWKAGVKAAWVTGDEVYGGDGNLRRGWSGVASATWSPSTAGRQSRATPGPPAPTSWPCTLARVDDAEGSRLVSGLDDAFALVAGRFFRREVRLRALVCVAGMLSGLERKTGWSLAEHAGEAFNGRDAAAVHDCPGGTRNLVRNDVRGYVVSALGDPGGVLIGDDTGFEKKGACSAGVQRQYTGTAGKITNCQLGVFLAYASPQGPGPDRP